jgi:NADPH-dependent curcumin reductase
LVVSAASGAVGATVGQLARIAGCRVIGIAGGPEKCDWVKRVAGFNDCIDYKNTPLTSALKQLCPKGIDVYFDNVGGEVLHAAIENLALHARVVLCGLMAQYNGASPSQLNAGLLIRWQHMQQMTKELGAFYQAGQLHFREDIQHGLTQAPAAFCRLMRGENQGKSVVLLDN